MRYRTRGTGLTLHDLARCARGAMTCTVLDWLDYQVYLALSTRPTVTA